MSNQPMPPPKPVKIRRSVLIGVIVTVSVALIILFVFLNSPRPEITVLTGSEGLQGLNYVFNVDVAVRNNGGAGMVTVHAQINGAGRYENQEQTIHLNSGESKSLKFVFDISLWGSLTNPSISYKAWLS